MSDIRSYRGSAAPAGMACPGSVNPPEDEVLIETSQAAATVGTVTHIPCRNIVHFGCVPADWQDVCRQYGLDSAQTKEVGYLVYAANAFWEEYGDAFPNPLTEVPLEHTIKVDGEDVQLTTHLDVLAISDDETEAVVHDWKTTRLELDYTPQLLFYAWVLILEHPTISKVTTSVAYLRDRSVDIRVWTLDQINAFAERFIERVVKWDQRTYTAGAHCGYCRRFANCPAQRALVATTRDEVATLESFGVDLLQPAQVVDLHQRLSVLSTMTEKVKDHIRAAVIQSGGEIIGDNGKALKLIDQSREEIDPLLGWPVLSRELSQAELAGTLKVSKTAALDTIAKHAARGEKGKAKEAVMDELRKAGAVNKKEFSVLRLVNAKNEPKEIAID